MTEETPFLVVIRVMATTRDEAIIKANDERNRLSVSAVQQHPNKVPQSIPRDQWPIWAKALARLAKPEDKGIGDVAARMIGAENSEAFKKWYKATTGKSCGCNGRQRRWNIEYPLP